MSRSRPARLLLSLVVSLMVRAWFVPDATAASLYPGPSTYLKGHDSGIALGDFDEDGYLDVFLGESYLRVGRGDGSGFFDLTPPPAAIQYDGITEPRAADFDGDGHLDIVGNGSSFLSGLVIARGRGDGSFEPPRTLSAPIFSYSRQLIVADVTEDGFLDVVSIKFFIFGGPLDSIVLYRGRGDGTFDPPTSVLAGPPVAFADIADLNGDGHLD